MGSRHTGLLAFVLASLVTAATPAYALTTSEIAQYTGADRQKMLVAGARTEGTLMFYTAMVVNQAVRPLKAAFEKKYPFLRLEYIRAGSSALLQRLLAEHQAHANQADVVIAGAATVLKKAKLAQVFTSPVLAAYPKELRDPEGMWATDRLSYNGFAYNTKLVKSSDAPKTWQDLLDPKWKGKLVWAASSETGGPLVVAILTKVWGEKKATSYLTSLAHQNVHVDSGSTRHVLDQVIAGEYPVTISAALHQVINSAVKGAPIAFSSPSPLLGRNEVAVVMKAAPHPHAAMLFIDFLLSKDGQQLLRKAHYVPADPDVAPLPQFAPYLPKSTGGQAYILTPDEFDGVRREAISTFNRLFLH